jgi:hypothetical protein
MSPTTSGGTLSISVPDGAAQLGTYIVPAGGATVSGQLGSVQVIDTRGGSSGAGWVVSVSASAFVPTSGPALTTSPISYEPGAVTQIRGNTVITDDHPSDIGSAVAAVTASGSSGDNAAATAWDPTISLTVPGGIVAGTYSSTVTQSVL